MRIFAGEYNLRHKKTDHFCNRKNATTGTNRLSTTCPPKAYNLKMKHIFLVLLSLLAFSCADEKHVTEELSRAKGMMEACPAGALHTIDSLYQAERQMFDHHTGLNAKRIILNTHCKYKLGRVVENDSLLGSIEDYVMKHGSDHDKMMVLFLRGSTYLFAENYDESYPLLLSALEFGKKTNDQFMLGQICTNMFRVCSSIESPDRIPYAEMALKHYQEYGDPGYILDSKVNLGIAQLFSGQTEKCYQTLKETLKESLDTKDTIPLVKSYFYLARAEIEYGLLDSAVVHLLKPKELVGWPDLCRNMDLLAETEADLGHKEKAYEYLEKAEKMAIVDINIEYHYEVKAKVNHIFGNDTEAFKALSKFHHISDSIKSVRIKNSVPKIERDNEKEKLERSEYLRTLLIIGICAFVFVVLAIAIFFRLRRTIQRQFKENILLKSSNDKLSKENQAEKDQFKQKTVYLLRQSQTVSLFKDAIKGKYKVQEEDWQKLSQSLQEAFPEFMDKLIKEECLTEGEMRICMLQKLNFQANEIGNILNLASNTISSTSARLYKKIKAEKGGAKEWQNYINSL